MLMEFLAARTNYGNLQVGDVAQSIWSQARANSQWYTISKIDTIYDGNGTTTNSTLKLTADKIALVANTATLNGGSIYTLGTGLSASEITSGTLPELRFPTTLTNDYTATGTWTFTKAGTSEIPMLQVTNNISVVFASQITSAVNMTNGFRTNTVSGAVTLLHATNGISGQLLASTVAFYNGSGSDQTLTIPGGTGVGWQTNAFSPVPTKLTNGWVTMMYLKSLGATDTAAKQTNVLVSFEYFAKP
jgi:hypothetical protein